MSNLERTAVSTAATAAALLEEKIRSHSARVGVVGLGYVGLPLAVEFAKAGFAVTGIDIIAEKTRRVNAGDSYVGDIPSSVLRPLVESGMLRATTDFSAVRELDTINICVPTPLRKTKDPDMSFIVSSCQEIANHFHPGMLVILESTTYPGTTDELVLPMLEKSGLKVGRDFFLCFSPERVDPGNPLYQTANIPKVVGGCTAACTDMGRLFYSQALQRAGGPHQRVHAAVCGGQGATGSQPGRKAGDGIAHPRDGRGIQAGYRRSAGIATRIHVMGVAYKRDIDDLRESPALDVMLLLKRRGGQIGYTDPYVPALHLEGLDLKSQPEEAIAAADCVVIVTDHSAFDYRKIVERAALIVDTRNALKGVNSPKIVRL